VALALGEVKRVDFTVTRRELEFWSDRGWLAEPGRFNVWIGPNSADGLQGSFELIRSSH
jgi:beta-glucosidase